MRPYVSNVKILFLGPISCFLVPLRIKILRSNYYSSKLSSIAMEDSNEDRLIKITNISDNLLGFKGYFRVLPRRALMSDCPPCVVLLLTLKTTNILSIERYNEECGARTESENGVLKNTLKKWTTNGGPTSTNYK